MDFDVNRNESIQRTKLQAAKDLYQKHLHGLLIQKSELEKDLRHERNVRLKQDDEIKYLKNKIDVEIKTMRSRIEDEYKNNFSQRQNQMRQ